MDIYNSEYTQAQGAENGMLEDNLRKDREIAQLQRDNFRAAHRAGVRMAFGTDAGVMPHAHRRRPVPLDGRIWDDADGGDPVRDPQRRRRRWAARATSARSRPAAMPTSSRSPAIRSPTSASSRSVDVVIKGGAIVSDRRAAPPPPQTP